jgi:polyhydroxybutyrate depolymerase
MMASFTALNDKADRAGFVVVYPDGTGVAGLFLTWNSGGLRLRSGTKRPDDVKFIAALLDDLGKVLPIDRRRVYATGMSNGGMMCYRLAAEMPDRIAAIAPVAGTMAVKDAKPGRPVPVIHFHGTADRIVPFGGPTGRTAKSFRFKSVAQSAKFWAKRNGCRQPPSRTKLPDKVDDGTTVERITYAPAKSGAEVTVYVIHGGGHTWPGRGGGGRLLGLATKDISANDLIWEFFRKHTISVPASQEGSGTEKARGRGKGVEGKR